MCIRDSGEADHRAEVFSGDFRLHVPPLFLGVLVLTQQCSYGRQSCPGGNQRNRPRIAAAPYQPASAAVPRLSASMIHLRATSRLKSGSQSLHLEEYLSLKMCIRDRDAYLQGELAAKKITRLSELSPLQNGIYLWRGDITTLDLSLIHI